MLVCLVLVGVNYDACVWLSLAEATAVTVRW